MKRFLSVRAPRLVLTVVTATMLAWSCSSVPITGRKQLSLVPESEMQAMSYQQYDQFLKENKLSTNASQTAMVKRVGHRIEYAVETYMKEHKMSDQLDGYQWEFNLVDSKEANAWCMPGGKVVVYTGILPITRDENGLAVVMGHEIAHAVARHGSERMSQGLIAQGLGTALAVAVQKEPETTQQLWMTAFGLGAQVGVLLPFSRTQESEADHLGLIFMAMAGYDPHVAVPFWQRMAEKGGGKPPEFLSTHPSDQTRINNLEKLMPEAMKYYRPMETSR
ncbi:MAG TPA: M48 family metallopeptidase [Candidatus Krumholzibacteria bacterium]